MAQMLQGKGQRLKPHEREYVEEVSDLLRLGHFIDKGWTLAEYEAHDPHLLDILRDRDGMIAKIQNPPTEKPQTRK